MAVPFDIDQLQVTGTPVHIIDGIRTENVGLSLSSVSSERTSTVASPGLR